MLKTTNNSSNIFKDSCTVVSCNEWFKQTENLPAFIASTKGHNFLITQSKFSFNFQQYDIENGVISNKNVPNKVLLSMKCTVISTNQ